MSHMMTCKNGFLLKLETIDQLGQCYKCLGDYDYMIKIYENGIDVCEVENEMKGYYCLKKLLYFVNLKLEKRIFCIIVDFQ